MRHVTVVSKRAELPAEGRSLLVWQAQLEVLNGIVDLVERVLGLLKGSGE
jgi:hypothetical protein